MHRAMPANTKAAGMAKSCTVRAWLILGPSNEHTLPPCIVFFNGQVPTLLQLSQGQRNLVRVLAYAHALGGDLVPTREGRGRVW